MTTPIATTTMMTVLANAAATGLMLAHPAELARAADGGAPAMIQIFPAGPDIEAKDGRTFKLSDPQGFVDRFNAAAQPVLVDYDHLSAFMPDDGGNTKAAGWIQRLEIRDGQVWAVVEWTVTAAAAIAAREYRYISPEFTVDKKSGEVADLLAAALVNRPAFQMAALARRKTGEELMLKAIAKALGLADDATEAQILAAISRREGEHISELASARNPKPDAFMPRADYDAVLARAETAEKKLKDTAGEARAKEVETVLNSAIKAGKIAPASRDHYLALCATQDGFDQVKKLVETLPAVIENPVLPEPTADGALTADQKALCRQMGLTEDAFKAELARQAA